MEKQQLTFLIFLLYQLAEAWEVMPSKVYEVLNSTGIIDDYIIPCYDTLHTQGSRYLVEDMSELVAERGGKL